MTLLTAYSGPSFGIALKKRLFKPGDAGFVCTLCIIPVQAVGGLSIEEAISTPQYGAPLVVIGAPLAIDSHAFSVASHDLSAVLGEIVRRINARDFENQAEKN